MGWYPCTCCESCCKDSNLAPGCPCVCVGKLPCETTLTIAGNHPATLKFPIEYARNPSSWPPTPDFCGLQGCAETDKNTSTDHTQLRYWEERDRLWDDMVRENKVCCGTIEDLNSGPPATVSTETLKAVRVSTRCYRADLRYSNLEVKVYQDRKLIYNEWVCGVTVVARLTFKRFLAVHDHTCWYFYGRRVTPSTNCPDSTQIPSDFYIECGWCEIDGVNTGTFSSGNLPTTPYPSMPPGCTPLSDEEWDSIAPRDSEPWNGFPSYMYGYPISNPLLNTPKESDQLQTFCIVRSKFLPGITSIGCNNPLTVELTPEDTISDEEPNYEVPNRSPCCDSMVVSQWFGYEYCQANTVLGENCNPFLCPGESVACPEYLKYGYFIGVNNNCLGEFGQNWTVDLAGIMSNTGDNAYGCTGNTYQGYLNVNNCEYACIVSRDRGFNLDYYIVNQTTLFGEAEDTWQLTIECTG